MKQVIYTIQTILVCDKPYWICFGGHEEHEMIYSLK